MAKPHVHLRCPANVHSFATERIIEFGYRPARGALYGGLISFFGLEDGLRVDVYRTDPGVRVLTEDTTAARSLLIRLLDRLDRDYPMHPEQQGETSDLRREARRVTGTESA